MATRLPTPSLVRPARVLLVIAMLLIMALQLVHVTHATSATWDEPHHLYDGYHIWKQGSYRLNPEVPPLIKLVSALPLLDKRLNIPGDDGRSMPNEAFHEGRAFVFSNGGDKVLQPARLACMCFTLALGLLLYLAAGELFGYSAALFALALYVFDPNFLAHGALVTTDVGSACLFLAATYAYYRYARYPTWPRLLLAGLAAGLLLAAKFTGIFIFPMLLLMILAELSFVRDSRLVRNRALAFVVMSLVAWTTLWAFYGFRYRATPPGQDLSPPLSQYLTRMYDQKNAARLTMLARYRVLPEGYIWGLENTKQTEWEDTTYFWGKVHRHGVRAYFPAAFLIKSTLPLLLIVCLTPLLMRRSSAKQLGIQEAAFLLIPVLVYAAISVASDMDIGLRHLLPVYPYLYILTAGVAATLFVRNPKTIYLLGSLLGWQIVSSLHTAPAYMAYGNEAWGGPSKVHRYLSDANTDWGQQLKDVKAYLDTNHITDCWFAYFPDGAIEPSDYGIPCKRLPTTDNLWWLNLPMSIPATLNGTVLISDGDLQGIEFGDGALNPYDRFRSIKPAATIDHGVYVYTGTFPVPLASALYHAHLADKQLSARHTNEAMNEAEIAVSLAPASAPVETTYADVLAASGRSADALDRYRAALRLAETIRPDLQSSVAEAAQKKISSLEQLTK